MDRHANPKLNSSLATGIVLGVGAVVAMAVAAAPASVLAPLVEASGLPRLISAAAPPLGTTARTLLALAIGGAVSAFLWAALRFDPRRVRVPTLDILKRLRPVARATPAGDAVPVQRRADAHPDAPARRPIHASVDLGLPLPIARPGRPATTRPLAAPGDQAIGDQAIPADLDQPLAAYDPAAIPDAPLTPVRPVAPLAPAVPVTPTPKPVAEAVPEPMMVETEPEVTAPPPAPAIADPIMRVAASPIAPEPASAATDSLAALVERLERATRAGAVPRRAEHPAPTPVAITRDIPKPAVPPVVAPAETHSIEDTLGMLRRLAAG